MYRILGALEGGSTSRHPNNIFNELLNGRLIIFAHGGAVGRCGSGTWRDAIRSAIAV